MMISGGRRPPIGQDPPLGELAPEASEGGGTENGGLHEFFARHRPESRYPESRTIHIFEDNYSIKVSILSVPDGNLGSRNFYASPLPVLWQLTASMGSRLYFLLAAKVKSLYNLVKSI